MDYDDSWFKYLWLNIYILLSFLSHPFHSCHFSVHVVKRSVEFPQAVIQSRTWTVCLSIFQCGLKQTQTALGLCIGCWWTSAGSSSGCSEGLWEVAGTALCLAWPFPVGSNSSGTGHSWAPPGEVREPLRKCVKERGNTNSVKSEDGRKKNHPENIKATEEGGKEMLQTPEQISLQPKEEHGVHLPESTAVCWRNSDSGRALKGAGLED